LGLRGVGHSHHKPEDIRAEGFLLQAKFARALDGLAAAGVLPGTGLVLDFGCGWGRWTRWLGEALGRAVGVDISESYIKAAQPTDHAEFVYQEDPLAPLPLEDGSVDLVFTCTVLQHLVRADLLGHTIREFDRVLAPTGALLLFEATEELSDKDHILFWSFAGYCNLFPWARLVEEWTTMIRGEKHSLMMGERR
jgi:ubiquinone/menaquinone biosynthesis C-methylase UbiE